MKEEPIVTTERSASDQPRHKKAEPSTELRELWRKSRLVLDSEFTEGFFSFCDGLSNILNAIHSVQDDDLESVRGMLTFMRPTFDVLTRQVKEVVQESNEASDKLGEELRAKGLIY